MIWKLKDLYKQCNGTSTEINGKWVPARPLNYTVESIFRRIKHAWMVLTGKAEAFIWLEGQ